MSIRASASTGGDATSGLGGFLAFEKPLLRIQHDIEQLEHEKNSGSKKLAVNIRQQRSRFKATMKRLYTNLTPWETVLVARHPNRPLSTDYLKLIFRDFTELHGDRTFGDDKALITGFARIGKHKVMFIGHNKGKDVKERIACNFGCAHPEGYRKALHKMKFAEKYGLPVVCLIDTQGAYPGIGSEERGISHAIAVNLMEMARLRTPIVCAVIGEGGSGGALGIGVGDRAAMFQHSFYSVISPEGCAAILWKTADHRQEAAQALRITAPELQKLGLIDTIIPEPIGGAHRNPDAAAESLEKYITTSLDEFKLFATDALVAKRQQRIRELGSFYASPSEIAAREKTKQRSARRSASRSTRLAKRYDASTTIPA